MLMIITVVGSNLAWIQINVQLLTTYTFLCYTASFKPFKLPLHNIHECINEVTVLFATYILFTYTDWVADAETRYMAGWASISMISLNVFNNLMFMIGQSLSHGWWRLKLIFTRRKAINNLKKKQQEKEAEEQLKLEQEA